MLLLRGYRLSGGSWLDRDEAAQVTREIRTRDDHALTLRQVQAKTDPDTSRVPGRQKTFFTNLGLCEGVEVSRSADLELSIKDVCDPSPEHESARQRPFGAEIEGGMARGFGLLIGVVATEKLTREVAAVGAQTPPGKELDIKASTERVFWDGRNLIAGINAHSRRFDR